MLSLVSRYVVASFLALLVAVPVASAEIVLRDSRAPLGTRLYLPGSRHPGGEFLIPGYEVWNSGVDSVVITEITQLGLSGQGGPSYLSSSGWSLFAWTLGGPSYPSPATGHRFFESVVGQPNAVDPTGSTTQDPYAVSFTQLRARGLILEPNERLWMSIVPTSFQNVPPAWQQLFGSVDSGFTDVWDRYSFQLPMTGDAAVRVVAEVVPTPGGVASFGVLSLLALRSRKRR